LQQLKPSAKANYRYQSDDEEQEVLRRAACTPGTRDGILKGVRGWGDDLSPECESLYWLFGPGGTGKTTIAYTVARDVELSAKEHGTITLGANFFCSRQFTETKSQKCIVRSLAYQLARKCKPFADALQTADLDRVNEGIDSQFQELLVRPWCDANPNPSTPMQFLIIIDALDEIDGRGGSTFLRGLCAVIKENKLPGLKFFVTSRPDPDLVSQIESFSQRKVFRLQDVAEAEIRDDIIKYLEESLPAFKGTSEMGRLQDFTGTLFISAATVVRHLTAKQYRFSEQKDVCGELKGESPLGGDVGGRAPEGEVELEGAKRGQSHKAVVDECLALEKGVNCTRRTGRKKILNGGRGRGDSAGEEAIGSCFSGRF